MFFSFSLFFLFSGGDSRFNLEQNIGCSVVGEQSTSWLYQQTKALYDSGVMLTFSDDQPFILKLFFGKTKDDAKLAHVSKMSLYVSDDSFTPLKIGETDRRMDSKAKIRQELPEDALAFAPTSAAICPDVTHGMIRCVKLDLKKWVNKLINVKGGGCLQEESIHQLEKNISERDVKRPYFSFNLTGKGEGKRCLQISLSELEAAVIIADAKELQGTGTQIGKLFEGVWNEKELLTVSNNINLNWAKKELHHPIIRPKS